MNKKVLLEHFYPIRCHHYSAEMMNFVVGKIYSAFSEYSIHPISISIMEKFSVVVIFPHYVDNIIMSRSGVFYNLHYGFTVDHLVGKSPIDPFSLYRLLDAGGCDAVFHPARIFVEQDVATLSLSDPDRIVDTEVVDDQYVAERLEILDDAANALRLVVGKYDKSD